jgi:hypothetical protein
MELDQLRQSAEGGRIVTHALLLILAAISLDVSSSQSVTVPRSIERTLIRVGAGLTASAGSEANLAKLCQTLEGDNATIEVRDARLLVNGQRTGSPWSRIAGGLAKVGLFVLHASDAADAVELRYTLVYQGLPISRSVTITQGQIVSRASFPCAMGPQGRVRHVWLNYIARESPDGNTTITTAATVRVNTGICPERSTSRLRIVNRLAGRAAGQQIDAALRDAINDGQRLSAGGHEAIVGHARRVMDHLMNNWK